MKSLVVPIRALKSVIDDFAGADLEILDTSDAGHALELLPPEVAGFTVHFAEGLFDLVTGGAYFFFVRHGKTGEVIAVVATKLEDTLDADLLGLLKCQWSRLYRAPGGGRAIVSEDQPAEFKKISGRLCYVGGLWVSPQCRGQGLATRLMRFAMISAALRWRPDWAYCWMRRPDLDNGNALRWGFKTLVRSGLNFDVFPEKWPDGLALCAADRGSLEGLADQLLNSPQ